jgi:hypothetical protein
MSLSFSEDKPQQLNRQLRAKARLVVLSFAESREDGRGFLFPDSAFLEVFKLKAERPEFLYLLVSGLYT